MTGRSWPSSIVTIPSSACSFIRNRPQPSTATGFSIVSSAGTPGAPPTLLPAPAAPAAITSPPYGTVPATAVDGVVLADCCSWRELKVVSIDSTPPRSRIETAVVHRGTRREFIGFNRACHAVLEAAIYATRLHILPRAFVESELERLQVIVDKTAGPREREAMALLADFIRSAAPAAAQA